MNKRLLLFLFALATFYIFGGLATAQTWIEPVVNGGPPSLPNYQLSVVRDSETNRAIVYGRRLDRVSEVWILTNSDGTGGESEWIKLNTVGAPPSRGNHSAVYDSVNNRMIIFGGCGGGCTPVYNDVWVLTNANGLGGNPEWIPLFPSGSPPSSRHASAVAYDPDSNKMIIYGGHTGSGSGWTTYTDLFVLSNANGLGSPKWTRLYPGGTPPPGLYGPSSSYDSANNRLIITGGWRGSVTNGTWVLINADGSEPVSPEWANIVPQGTAGAPYINWGPAFFDHSANRMMVLGDSTDRLKYWILNNANGLNGNPIWTPHLLNGEPPLPPPPIYPGASPWAYSAVYDSEVNRAMVLFHMTPSEGDPGYEKPWVIAEANGVDECIDSDGDDFSVEGGDCGPADCDDTDAAVYPGAVEICDGLDNNCDGAVDEGLTSLFYQDADSDGHGDLFNVTAGCTAPDGYVSSNTDCNDNDASIYPGAAEIPYDGIDQDCSGADLTDVDGDGYDSTAVPDGNDCNDNNSAINPGVIESCDGIDNNCDGQVDEENICVQETAEELNEALGLVPPQAPAGVSKKAESAGKKLDDYLSFIDKEKYCDAVGKLDAAIDQIQDMINQTNAQQCSTKKCKGKDCCIPDDDAGALIQVLESAYQALVSEKNLFVSEHPECP